MYYFLLTTGSIAVSIPEDMATFRLRKETVFVGICVLLLFVSLIMIFVKRFCIWKIMEKNLLDYKKIREVKDVNFIFEELTNRHCKSKSKGEIKKRFLKKGKRIKVCRELLGFAGKIQLLHKLFIFDHLRTLQSPNLQAFLKFMHALSILPNLKYVSPNPL